VASPASTLALWDRVLAFNATEVLAAAAAAVFAEAADDIAGASCASADDATADAGGALADVVTSWEVRGGVVACLRRFLLGQG